MNAKKSPARWLSPASGILFVLHLVLTLLNVGFNGLDTPLSHALAGAAALFFVLFIISERYHPQPLMPRHLRASLPLQISFWTGIFVTAVTCAAWFLLAVTMYQIYGFGGPGIILCFATLLLMMVSGKAFGEKLGRNVTSASLLLWGFMIAACGLGVMAIMPAFGLVLLPGMLLTGFGAGMARQAAATERDQLTGDEYHYASRLGGWVRVSSALVMLALLTLLLKNNPGRQGIENGYSLLAALALAGVVTALMIPAKRKRDNVTVCQSDNGRFHRQE
uniref:hypothetical protein n=1 Tax=Rahnella sp. RFA10(1/100) TaxID=2511202 RepID=UPI00102077ED|nr:hypothetical protein [Rahnella sp. RFA10(1/100)]